MILDHITAWKHAPTTEAINNNPNTQRQRMTLNRPFCRPIGSANRQTNAANAEEGAAASEQLSSQAVEMKRSVDKLTLLVNGKGAASEDVNSVPKGSPTPVGTGVGQSEDHCTDFGDI